MSKVDDDWMRDHTAAPPVSRILETALYADDLSVTSSFYKDIFGFAALVDTPRLCALDIGGRSVLLIFKRGATAGGLTTDTGFIPPHDANGPAHFAFAIDFEVLPRWEAHLASKGIEIESRVEWERGGVSLYFRDPDGHSVELVTPGTWATY
ncbi:MAG TPA: VOC family protein [Gemmatimonadaceae bacterium]|nr:VOC family protein [Gemmatimonadaceae bacterium]